MHDGDAALWLGVPLIVLGCLPITGALMSIAMASMMPMDQGKQGKQDKDGKQNKSAGSIIGEVVFGIRTVASFNAELQFYEDYAGQVDEIRVKGRQTPAVIYEVLGTHPWAQEETAWRDAHAFGLAQYRAGRWTEARSALEEAVALRGHDGPSAALLARMRALDATPPDAWDGIWSFETK